ncbi:MAG: selenide, water dikinase SelD [Dethiobacter sp.]|jgi:selenide,water dikinase|nr:selenide, water dikinase SelD [Dethiobacter sp.]
MPPGVLAQVLCHLPQMDDENLLVGCDSFADAGVYRVREDLALVQTVDFFTPVVDDPYLFGQVAAANSLSDVYAMGARPLTAMNIVCFPYKTLDVAVLGKILQGGADKIMEAGAVLVGGHSINDDEPKYGLAVTGIIHPQNLITNSCARPGDSLILTKPLGSGLILTAAKAEMDGPGELEAVIRAMAELNREASEAMQSVGVNAATDITGFGLLGHAREIALSSKVSIELSFGSIPLFTGALQAASMGLVPGGAYANREYVAEGLEIAEAIGEREIDVLCDPQTSGGLLIAVPPEKEKKLTAQLENRGVLAAVIGKVLPGRPGIIKVMP